LQGRSLPFPPKSVKFSDFAERFLQVVLAKCDLPRGMGFNNGAGRERLADRNQPDILRRPAGEGSRGLNTPAYSLQASGYCCHNPLALLAVTVECSEHFLSEPKPPAGLVPHLAVVGE
jgi:hypothetical protein